MTMSATVGMLTQYADTTKWRPTLASKDASKQALQDTAWADVRASQSSYPQTIRRKTDWHL